MKGVKERARVMERVGQVGQSSEDRTQGQNTGTGTGHRNGTQERDTRTGTGYRNGTGQPRTPPVLSREGAAGARRAGTGSAPALPPREALPAPSSPEGGNCPPGL